MRARLAVVFASAATVALAVSPLVKGATYTPPRTPWGDPDLQGSYSNKNESGIPFERPAEFDGRSLADVDARELGELIRKRAEVTRQRAPQQGGAATGAGPVQWLDNYDAKNSRAWLIVDPPDGHFPPLTPAAAEREARVAALNRARNGEGRADSYEDRSLWDRCITRGIPGSMLPTLYGNSYQIVQGPGYVAIRYEMVHELRVVPLDGRPHVSPRIRTFTGDPRGRFDGNTLVVETTNFNGRTHFSYNSMYNSDRLRLVERFTPTSPDRVEWTVTVDDPGTWTRPWTFAMTLTKDAAETPFEYACHEGNHGLADILSGARAEDARAAKDR